MTQDPATQQPPPPRLWTGRSRGGALGTTFFIVLVRTLGLRLGYVILLPVCLYFLLTAPAARRASRQFFAHLPRARRGWAPTCRHFYAFGQALLDRIVAMSSTRRFRFDFDGEEHIAAALAQPGGVLLLSGHVGSWQVAARAFDSYDRPLHVVMYAGEAHRIRAVLERHLRVRRFHIIEIDGTPESVWPVVSALNRGELVAMYGDRRVADRGVTCRFLGRPARFPIGPFAAAAACQALVVHTFCTRRSAYRYHLKAHAPYMLQRVPRAQRDSQLAACAQRFAVDLEAQARQHPAQWFNFFDFWSDADPS